MSTRVVGDGHPVLEALKEIEEILAKHGLRIFCLPPSSLWLGLPGSRDTEQTYRIHSDELNATVSMLPRLLISDLVVQDEPEPKDMPDRCPVCRRPISHLYRPQRRHLKYH